MPTPEEILSGLREIANAWRLLAIFWHVYFAALVLALILGVRPSRRLAGLLLVAPLFSVSVLAWASGNPFNGIFFALSGAALLIISIRFPGEKIRIAPLWAIATGAILFAFGWIYPHFLETESYLPYFYSAPVGLIPCPTLAIVFGLSIILGSFGARAWAVVLAVTGAFYGVFGAAHLGISLDWVLLIAALLVVLACFKDTIADRSNGVG